MPDNQTNSQQAPSDDPVASQLKSYADSIVASDPAASRLGHYADVLERKDKVSKANQIVSEVQSGKRPEMNEQDLLPVMKVASLDPETGKPTTPAGRAGSALKSFNKLWFDSEAPNWYQKVTVPGMAAITGGKFLTTPAMRENAGNAIQSIGSGAKGFYKEAGDEDAAHEGQGLLNEIGGVVGGTAKWAQGTGIQAMTGVQNVEKQLTEKGIDPDLANVQAALLQGKINRGITTGEEAVGVQPESYAYAGGANVGPFLLPPYGAGELAGATTKAVRGTEALASKAVGIPMEYGAKTASGTAKMITKPLEKIPFGLGSVPRQYMVGLSEGLTDPVEIVGRALRGKDSTMAEGLARETQKSIADDQATIDYVTKKHELKSDDAVFQKKPSGQWMFDDASPMLSKEEKEVRAAQRAVAWKQSALGAIEKTKGFNEIVNYARDIGLVGTANTAVGSAIGGGLSVVNAPPGEESQAAQSGGAFGALLAGVPGHYGAWRDVSKAMQGERAKANAQMLNEAGSKIAPQSQNLSPEAQSLINKTAAVINQAGGATIRLHPEDEFLKFSQDVMAKKRPDVIPIVEPATQSEGVQAAPNGYYDSAANVLHLNENAVNADPTLVGHEVGHFTQKLYGRMLDQARPDLVPAMDKAYAEAMSKTGRQPSFNSRGERDAEVGRILLQQTPIENFYGGKRIFDTLDPQNIINALKARFGGYHIDKTLQVPVSQDDLNKMRERMFQVGSDAAKAPRTAPSEPQATSVPNVEQTQPTATTQAPSKPVEQVVNEVEQIAKPKVIPAGGVNPQDAVNFLVKMGQTKENAIAKAHAAVQDLKGEGTPVTLENIVKKAMQRSIPKPIESVVNEVDQAARSTIPQTNEEPSRTPTETVPQETTEPAPERGMAGEVQTPAESSDHPDYQAIRAEAETARREELAGTRRKTKEQEIARAGLEAMAQAHAGHVDDPDLVTWRTNKYGKTSISGRKLDPNDPFHAHLLKQANLSPEDVGKLNFIESNMGKTLTADYLHAPEEGEASGITRKSEQAESGAPERVSGEAASRRLSKSFVPTSFTFNAPSKTFEVNGFSPDKFLNNAQMLIPWAKANGLKAWKDINDPSFATDFQNGVENHKNGYTLAGKPIEGTPLTRVKPNPDYEPHTLSKDKADLLNAMMGDTSARVVDRKQAPYREVAKADKQILAQQNSPYWEPQTGEVNRIRAKLGDNAKLLESTFETLRPELIDNLRTDAVNDAQTLRPSGFEGDRGAFAEKGLPRGDFSASGFMPNTNPKAIKEPALRDGNGKIYVGSNHYAAAREAEIDKGSWKGAHGAIQGFVTNEGEFLDREQAHDRAMELGQIAGSNDPGKLHSGFMPAIPKHLDAVAKELGLSYDGLSLGGKAHQFTDDKTKSSLDVPKDTTPDDLRKVIQLSREKFGDMPQFMPSTKQGAIASPALKMPDGKIFEGAIHADALTNAYLSGNYSDKTFGDASDRSIAGFTDNKGNFLTREEAMQRAKQIGQVTRRSLKRSEEHIMAAPKDSLEALTFARARQFHGGGLVKIPRVESPLKRVRVA